MYNFNYQAKENRQESQEPNINPSLPRAWFFLFFVFLFFFFCFLLQLSLDPVKRYK